MFQLNIYKLFNNDLKKLSNNHMQIHWKTIGKKENRISNVSHFFKKYPNFKINLYKEKYPEIKNYDDIIIMAHYHHNNSKELTVNYHDNINKTNETNETNDFNNYIETYLTDYYKYDYDYCIILFDYCENININDIKFDKKVYLFTNKNYEIENDNIIIHKINFDIFAIHDLILNIKSDYFLFLKNLHIQPTNLIHCNPNIIYNNNYLFIKKNILKFYNFFTLLYDNIDNFKINNKIIIDNNETKYLHFKFYHLNNLIINNNNTQTNNHIFINLNIDNYNDLFYIIKIISYFENKNFNIYLLENNYLFFKKYFVYDNNLDLKIINNINDINNKDNFIINNKIDFNQDDFKDFKKINNVMINDIFKNLLFLDLKKEIIIIYLDNNTNENFIINSLMNLDFQNSIIIILNVKNIQLDFLNYFTYLTLQELYDNISKKININYLDLELIIGLFADYYIGPNNYISYIWNYLSSNLILYINNYNDNYYNLKNLIINNNILNTENFNHKIICYNFNLFKVYQNKLLKINNKNNFYIDYYFNDYILKLFFNKDSFILKVENSIIYNKNINIFKHNNQYYLKYFNQYQKIHNDFYIENHINNTLLFQNFYLNRNHIIDKFIFVIQIFNIDYIKYYEQFFSKYYYDKNYIIEFYLKNSNKKVYLKNEKNKINYLNNNNFIVILEDIYSKYNYNDLIIIIKANNFNIIQFDKEMYNFIYNNSLFYDNKDYLILNLRIFENNNDNKKVMDILKLNRIIDKPNDIDQNIIYYMNINYLNDFDFNKLKYNKCTLTKFLIYSEQIEHNFYNFNNIFNFINEDNKNINYISYNIKSEILKFILNETDLDDNVSDIEDEYSIHEEDKNNEFKINIYNLNLLIEKLNTNYIFVIDIFKHSMDIQEIDMSNMHNSVIYNKFDELSILILDGYSIKKCGFLNDYYFKDDSLINLNLFLFNKIIDLNFYKFDDKIIESSYKNNSKISNYFDSININTILNIRKNNNLNFIYNYNDIIDIYIINLNDRYDKKKYMMNQLNKLNINNYQFFNACKITKDKLHDYQFIKSESFLNHLNINYVTGSAGCKISHYELIKNLNNNNKFTLILEDDVVLETNFMNYIFTSLNQLHNKYFDLLYLGCNLDNKNDNDLISNNVLSVKHPKTTTAYLIKNSNTNNILTTIQNSFNEIDEAYSQSSQLVKYCIYPMIAYQKNLKSDIVSTNNYGYYHDKFYY